VIFVDKNEVAEKIKNFLTSKGFEFGNYGGCRHNVGIDYACARVKPKYSPIDGSYTITVDPVTVKGWACRIPYNYTRWELIWQKPYRSQEELVRILNDEISPPVGCWGDSNL